MAASSTTRDKILAAALACFTEEGYERTTIARVRERSNVSNGALFHHFRTKEAIAEALYVDAMRSVQEGYWEVLHARPRSLRPAVDGFVRAQLRWIEAHPDHARFLYAQGHLDWSSDAGAELEELNRDLAAAYQAWLDPLVAAGKVHDLPMVLVIAILTGPAHAVAQRWLAGHLRGDLRRHADPLIDAAVAGLTGTPTRRKQSSTPVPAESRVRVQLLDADGAVVAEGEAVAPLARPAT